MEEGRGEGFRSLQDEFKSLRPLFQTDTYEAFGEKPLNNAVLLGHRQYYHRQETFEMAYQILGRDLKRLLALMKEIHSSGEEPFLYLDHWIKAGQSKASFLE